MDDVTGDDPRPDLGLRQVINAAGTMTVLGASAAVPEAIAAAARILPWFVEIDGLQRAASRAIVALTGAEAGFVTASASAGISLAVAAAMTGTDRGRVEQLPDTAGMANRVIMQQGHRIDYGAPIDTAVRITGARIVSVGQATSASRYQLQHALAEPAVAVVHVVSHHVSPYGQMPLAEVIEVCRAANVPLIVDAASEYDLAGFIAAGADIVVYSAHKFLGGLTAGIVAGRKDLVRAAYAQNRGIGRGMKVGKEAVAATIAALEAWSRRDHNAHQARENAAVRLWAGRLQNLVGVRAEAVADPTGNPITRLRVRVGPETGTTAWDLSDALASGSRPVMVRDDEIDLGYFELDPCNLRPGEAEEIADRITAELVAAGERGTGGTTLSEWRRHRDAVRLRWPD
jgi:L-seryl-tRNA(Ser) seleniumtransferase